MRTISFISFDLDGTLAEWTFERIVLPWVFDEFARLGVTDARDLMYREQLRRFDDLRRVEAFHWDEIARTVAKERGLDWPHELVKVMRSEGLSQKLQVEKLYPDVPDALARLRSMGCHLAIVSNGHAKYQQIVFELMGVAHLFDVILGPDVLGMSKPDPRVFTHEILSEQVKIHVGDLLSQDVRAAKRARIMAVYVARPPQALPGCLEYSHLAPSDRPLALFESGWLSRQYEKEHRYLGRAMPATGLNPRSEAFPDAVLYSFSELVGLVPNLC